jgi:hypothetical protein
MGMPVSKRVEFNLLFNSEKESFPEMVYSHLFNDLVSKNSCFVFMMQALTGGIYCGITDQHPFTSNFSGGRVAAASLSNDMFYKFSDKSRKDRDHVRFVSSMKAATKLFPLSFLDDDLPDIPQSQHYHCLTVDPSNGLSIRLKNSYTKSPLPFNSNGGKHLPSGRLIFYITSLHIYHCKRRNEIVDSSTQTDVNKDIQDMAHVHENKTIDPVLGDNIKSVMEGINKVLTLSNKLQKIKQQLKDYEVSLKNEIDWVIAFLIDMWSSIIPDFPKFNNHKRKLTDEDHFECIFSYLDEIKSVIVSYHKVLREANSQEKMNLNPIASFNVEGERICILKSTLQEIIPESPLTISIASGRWEEQERNLDEDGNIIIEDIDSKVFKALINSLRDTKFNRTKGPLWFQVTPEEMSNYKNVLDFYLIENYQFI